MISCSFATWAQYGRIGVFGVESENNTLAASVKSSNPGGLNRVSKIDEVPAEGLVAGYEQRTLKENTKGRLLRLSIGINHANLETSQDEEVSEGRYALMHRLTGIDDNGKVVSLDGVRITITVTRRVENRKPKKGHSEKRQLVISNDSGLRIWARPKDIEDAISSKR